MSAGHNCCTRLYLVHPIFEFIFCLCECKSFCVTSKSPQYHAVCCCSSRFFLRKGVKRDAYLRYLTQRILFLRVVLKFFFLSPHRTANLAGIFRCVTYLSSNTLYNLCLCLCWNSTVMLFRVFLKDMLRIYNRFLFLLVGLNRCYFRRNCTFLRFTVIKDDRQFALKKYITSPGHCRSSWITC